MYPTLPPTGRPPTATADVVTLPTHPGSSRRDSDPADTALSGRDQVEPLRTERDSGAAVVTRPDDLPVRPDDPHIAWVRRARAAGHPVVRLAPGRYRPQDLMPIWSFAMPPNDLLDAARENARHGVDWVHAVLPDLSSLLALHASIVTPPPRTRRRLRGGPTATPWPRLVAQQNVGLRAVSDIRDGRRTNVLEIPAVWLHCPILPGGPPRADPRTATG